VKQVPVGRARIALIDDQDADRICVRKWSLCVFRGSRTAYAAAWIDGKFTLLHRYLLEMSNPAIFVDHVNGCGLDNRRANLRICTHAQNRRNSRITRTYRGKPKSSRFKGVSLTNGRWLVQVQADGRKVHVGRFSTEEDAARAYDFAARKLHGEYACLNFPEPGERGALVGDV